MSPCCGRNFVIDRRLQDAKQETTHHETQMLCLDRRLQVVVCQLRDAARLSMEVTVQLTRRKDMRGIAAQDNSVQCPFVTRTRGEHKWTTSEYLDAVFREFNVFVKSATSLVEQCSIVANPDTYP